MQKEIGYSKIENPEIGTINQWKLAEEFAKAGISILDFAMYANGRLVITYDAADEAAINAVITAHDPTPEPIPLTDLQQTQLAVAEAVEKQETDKIEQQLAQAEMFETILQMLEQPQGGGE